MKRYLMAAIVLTAFGTHAAAQTPQPPIAPPPGGMLPAPKPVLAPPSFAPLTLPAAGPNGFVVSGGRVIGADGNYPFDSGMYLLGGTDIARVTGTFRMVSPGTPGGPPATVGTSSGTGSSGCRCAW